jgi:hypothetical protein
MKPNRPRRLLLPAASTRIVLAGVAAILLPLLSYAGGSDSLRTLQILIRSELDAKHRILILEDPALSDSLLRGSLRPREDRLLRLLGDSAVAREVRTRDEFRRHWARLEEREGFRALRDQYAGRDIDKGRVPKAYLFDSAMVVYPGWIVLRKKPGAGAR